MCGREERRRERREEEREEETGERGVNDDEEIEK